MKGSMNSSIKISLILPAYNVESYIGKCIESCLLQDLNKTEYEIIIVNDGSTDSTLEIALSYKYQNSNIYILSQINQGLSMARNNGAKIAKGKYIWFIDSDDYIAQNCLMTILNIIESQKLEIFGVGPKIQFQERIPENFNIATDINKVVDGTTWIKKGIPFIGAWAYVFDRDFWVKNNFNFYPGICYEDTELIPKVCLKAQRISTFNKFSCYSYVMRPGSIMNSAINEKKIFDLSKILNSYLEYLSEIKHTHDKDTILEIEKIISSLYMGAIVNIAKHKSHSMLKKWLKSVPKHSYIRYGNNIIENIFQYIAFKTPLLFFNIRKFL